MPDENSPAALAAARRRGRETAAANIAAGKLRMHSYGIPQEIVDPKTGYPVDYVEGCIVSQAILAEIDEYNAAMTDWHSKTAGNKKPVKSQDNQ